MSPVRRGSLERTRYTPGSIAGDWLTISPGAHCHNSHYCSSPSTLSISPSQVFCPPYSSCLPAARPQKQAGNAVPAPKSCCHLLERGSFPGEWREHARSRRDTSQRGPAATGTCCSGDGLILPRDIIPVTLMTEGDVRKQDYRLVLQRAGGVHRDKAWRHPRFQHRLPVGRSMLLPKKTFNQHRQQLGTGAAFSPS